MTSRKDSKTVYYRLVCLKCDKPFQSIDKARNRLCKTCRESNHHVTDLKPHASWQLKQSNSPNQ